MAGALVLSGCSSPFFQPLATYPLTPAMLGLQYQPIRIVSGRQVLAGWFLPAKGCARGSVLFVHGNGQNMAYQLGSVAWLPAEGYNVLTFDYRGYGASSGHPGIRGSIRDVRAALTTLTRLPGINANRLVVFGQSLGGAFVLYAMGHPDGAPRVEAVITDSAFSDYRSVARAVLSRSWVTWALRWPLSWFVPDHDSPMRAVAHISPTPLLIVHSIHDPLVPVAEAKRLFAAARAPKTLWLFAHGGHIQAFNSLAHRERLVRYLRRVLGPAGCGRRDRSAFVPVDPDHRSIRRPL